MPFPIRNIPKFYFVDILIKQICFLAFPMLQMQRLFPYFLRHNFCPYMFFYIIGPCNLIPDF